MKTMMKKMIAFAAFAATFGLTATATTVAKIGDTEYETLQAAIADVPTTGAQTTIQMVADEAFTGTNPLMIAAGKNVVLDLNGKTLSYVASNTDADAFITNKGDLTVTDTSANKDGKITAKQNTDPSWTYGCYTIDNAGTYDTTGHLVVNAGTIENTSGSGLAWPINNGWWGTKADCVISGGTIHSANYVPIRQYYQYGGCKTMTISGGTFIADNSRAVAVQFSDATVQETEAYVKITGGTFTCNGSCTLYMDLHAANVDTTGANITVSGGTFTNNNTSKPLIDYDDEGNVQTSAVLLGEIISGGTYSADPTAWVAEGYEATQSGDNWIVGAKPVAALYKDGVKVADYASVTNAVKAYNEADPAEETAYLIEIYGGTYDVFDCAVIQSTKKSLTIRPRKNGDAFEKVTLRTDAVNPVFKISGISVYGTLPTEISSISFDGSAFTGNYGMINMWSGDTVRYASHVTISNCTFQGDVHTNAYAVNANSHSSPSDIRIVDCSATSVWSLWNGYLANNAGAGITVTGCTVTNSGYFVCETSGSADIVIDRCKAVVSKQGTRAYAVRYGGSGVNDSSGASIRITNSEFDGDDGYCLFVCWNKSSTPVSLYVDDYTVDHLTGDSRLYDVLNRQSDGTNSSFMIYRNGELVKTLTGISGSSSACNGYFFKTVAQVISSDGVTTNGFDTLQAAFNRVRENGMINVLADNTETITVTNTCAFTFNSNGYDLSGGTVTPAEGYAFTKNGNICTYGEASPYVAQIGETKYTSLTAAYADAQSGDTIKLLVSEIDSLADNDAETKMPAGITIKGVEGKTSVKTKLYHETLNGMTFKNLKFVGDMGIRMCYLTGATTFTLVDCEFDPTDYYCFHFDGDTANGSIIASNTIFRSTVALAGGIAPKFYSCQFLCNTHQKDVGLSLYSDTMFTNCVFAQEYLPGEVDAGGSFYVRTDNTLITLDDCSIQGGGNLYDMVKRARLTACTAVVAIGGTRDGNGKFTDGLFLAKLADSVNAYVAQGYAAQAHATIANGWTLYELPRTIEVTPETVQAALDSAKKGDTIVLTAGDYGTLYLRNNGTAANRIFEDVTIKVKDGAAVTVEQIKYDRTDNVKTLDIENLTIDGITFDVPEKSAVLFNVNGGKLRVNGLTVQNCTKVGNNSQGTTYDNAAFIGGYYDGATAIGATFAGDTSLTCGYHDIKILNSTITGVFQPIKFPNSGPLYGLTVTGNTFTGCTDNHFMLSTKTSGNVLIANNTIVNMTGRFARISGAEANAALTVTNNVVTTPYQYDTGNDGTIFKVSGTKGFTITEENNQWDNGAFTSEAQTTWESMGDESKLPVAKIGSAKYHTVAAAYAAANAGDTVTVIVGSLDSLPMPSKVITVEGQVDEDGNPATTITGTDTALELRGTIKNFIFQECLSGVSSYGGVVYNCKFTGKNGIKDWWSREGGTLIEKCVFDVQTYGINFSQSNDADLFKDCDITGWNSFSTPGNITFYGCTFAKSRVKSYAYLRFYSDATVKNCHFSEDFVLKEYAHGINANAANAIVSLDGCTVGGLTNAIYNIVYQKTVPAVFAFDAGTDSEDNYNSGTFVTKDTSLIPLSAGCVLFAQGNDVYQIGLLVNKDDDKNKVPAIEQASDVSVDVKATEKVVEDPITRAKIETETTVVGVKLTTETNTVVQISGMQAVVDKAKDQSAEVKTAIESDNASIVTVKVDVVVTPISYTPPVEQQTAGAVAFELTPKATVTVVTTNGTETSSVSEVVEVTNGMIDQDQKITVSIYTGFLPSVILHKDPNGKLIDSYTGDDFEYKDGTCTLLISHFSTLEAIQNASYVATSDGKMFDSLQAAFDYVTNGTVTLLKDIELTAAATLAADKKATLDLGGKTIAWASTATEKGSGLIANSGTLTLTGGTLDAGTTVFATCTGNGETTPLYITDGFYKGTFPTSGTVTNAGPLLISGGYFQSVIPAAFCAVGYLPNEDPSAIYGMYTVKDALVYIRNVKAVQRYPWNGYVDITFDMCMNREEAVTLFVAAYYENERVTGLAEVTWQNAEGGAKSVNVKDGTFKVAAPAEKTIHLVWNSNVEGAFKDVKADDITVKVIAK